MCFYNLEIRYLAVRNTLFKCDVSDTQIDLRPNNFITVFHLFQHRHLCVRSTRKLERVYPHRQITNWYYCDSYTTRVSDAFNDSNWNDKFQLE